MSNFLQKAIIKIKDVQQKCKMLPKSIGPSLKPSSSYSLPLTGT